jgi:hypothetical protein
MSDPRIDENVLIYPFDRGIDCVIVVDSEDIDFSEYVKMYADVKEEYNLPSTEVLKLELGDGLEVSTVGEFSRLTIAIGQEDTADFGQNRYFMDVKGVKSGSDTVYLIMRVKLVKNETGTNIPVTT